MNGNILTRIAVITAIIAGISLLIAGIIGITSGAFRSMSKWTFLQNKAGRAHSVTINERKSLHLAGINNITINAVSEDITVRETSGSEITAWFHGSVELASREDKPHLRVDQRGDTAEIRIERHQHTSFGWMNDNTVLEIGIPKQYAGELSADGVSADVALESHNYKELSVATVSGDIKANVIKTENLTIHTTSGDIGTKELTAMRAEINSISGDIDMKNFSGNINADSTSGDVALTFKQLPQNIAVNTVSGEVHLGVPGSAGFALNAHSTSGDISCDFPVTITNARTGIGEHNLNGAVGNSKRSITAETLSGDIKITRSGRI